MAVAAAVNTAARQSPPEEEYGEFLARPKELASVSAMTSANLFA
jgi:hypothetical protein